MYLLHEALALRGRSAKEFPILDPNDRASHESDMALELRNRDRERKLIKKIDETIARI